MVWAMRRGMLRTPILNMTRLSSATNPTMASTIPSMISRATMM